MNITFGQACSFISLAFGIIFFIYAAKYYFSIVTVFWNNRGQGNHNNNNNHKNNLNYRNFKNNLNHRNNLNYRNFNNNNNRQPFVSIHLPFYNEKNVADRILRACTSLDYENYEVVVVDDSTDETVEILKKWMDHPRVKIIHRKERSGFKGGALNEALRRMDKKAEYVVVFDADFIPPKDIIHQFLWYFNRQNLGNNNNKINRGDLSRDERLIEDLKQWYRYRETAAVQGYQWHYLNRGENWLTRGVRFEYSGSYMIERVGQELFDSMRMIAGSVFMIKADVIKKYGWKPSLTEDWELTLRLYRGGHKVHFTPYISVPAECPSTFRELRRQRMRWAEGHTFNVKKHFWKIMKSANLTLREKLEFLYYAPYYLQSLFFLVGTVFWFMAEFAHDPLPFWTPLFGWSLLLTNMIALPLMGLSGLFLEQSVEKDFAGIFSFIALSYALAPFQAYAAIKGLFEKEEGMWFRTFKTGKITEVLKRLHIRRILRELLPRRRRKKKVVAASGEGASKKGRLIPLLLSNLNPSRLLKRRKPGLATILIIIMSTFILTTYFLGMEITPTEAAAGPTLYFHGTSPGTMDEYVGSSELEQTSSPGSGFSVRFDLQGGVADPQTITTSGYVKAWLDGTTTGTINIDFTIYDTETAGVIASGSGTAALKTSVSSFNIPVTSGGEIPSWHRIYIVINFGAHPTPTETITFYWDDTAAKKSDSQFTDSNITIPENALLLALLAPAIPLISRKKLTRKNERLK